jgi:hypothetical protein
MSRARCGSLSYRFPGMQGDASVMTWLRVLLVAAPAVVLAALGPTHPDDLTAATASWWTTLHLILLVLFPLLGVSLWLLLEGVPGPLAWLGRQARSCTSPSIQRSTS